MCKYTKFITGLGFSDVKKSEASSTPKCVKRFTFGSLDPASLRKSLGKSKKHDSSGRFAFVLSKTQAVFLSVHKKNVVLCNGADAVKRMLESFE